MNMENANQYSVVVLPKESWENIIKTLEELKYKVERLPAQEKDEWLDSKAVCEYLGISLRQFQKYRDERRIAFSQFGRKVYVKRSDIDNFLDKHRIKSRYE